jgi:phosphonate transport system substrate-binding protein
VTIWSGFRAWLASAGLPFDFVLYSNYERQTEDLVAGRIHAAWNSPLAWVRTRRMATASGRPVRPLVMRDTDRDLTSMIVVRADSGLETVADLKGTVVATGAVDSPQATLIPLSHLRRLGLRPGQDLTIRRFDVGIGLHGDHVGGERDAVRALLAGEADATCVADASHLLFTAEGTLPGGSTRVLTRTGPYDHCNMTVSDAAPGDLADRFGALLISMDYADTQVRPLLDLEGLTAWVDGRDSGYSALETAVADAGFYDDSGAVTADQYHTRNFM